MVNANIKEKYENIFLRGHMRDLVSLANGSKNTTSIQGPSVELALLQASAYYELNDLESAKKAIKDALDGVESSTDCCIYACARLCYLNGELEKSDELFSELLEYTDDQEYQFKALLGLANIAYVRALYGTITKEQFKEVLEPMMFDLEHCLPEGKNSLLISFEFFKGHCKRLLMECDQAEILAHYKTVVKIASRHNWTYYQAKGLYGQAAVYQAFNELNQMKWTLDLLEAFIDENEMIMFSRVVNKMFEDYKERTSLPVKFDTRNQRICFGESWVPLHDRPLIYRFLESVQGQESFVSKGTVAKSLWPDQEYKPRIHDPRIFDVAKRARNILTEKSESLKLLSGRVGYKLVNE